jgi:hypothetical protein
MANKKQRNKQFLDKLAEDIGQGASVEEVLAYLIERNFITDVIIRRFMSVRLYPEILEKTKTEEQPRGNKRAAVWEVSDLTGVCESQIWSNISNHSCFFCRDSTKLPK